MALSAKDHAQVVARIQEKIDRTQEDILEYEELVRPIAPENAIGRISRMDAINNKSISEAALLQSKAKLARLKSALLHSKSDHFGRCNVCEKNIEMNKLMVMPESRICVACTKNAR
ncbi:MAG: DnaK suppressor protein [Bacteroidia bacterium]|jgi:DnaK suppressor protein